MSRILFAWELGEGLGHVTNIRPVAIELAKLGHEVVVASRNVRTAAVVLDGTAIPYMQCPHQNWRLPRRNRPIVSYAHLLHTTGFGDAAGLTALVGAWRSLFEQTRPDLVVFDHSPTALLACRGTGIRRVTLGSGFFSPPDVMPLPRVRNDIAMSNEELVADERRVLETANTVLTSLSAPPLESLGRLYSEVELNMLTTYPELDHFGERPGQRYWGVHTDCPAAPPEWPPGEGSRIFAYLKPMPILNDLLMELGRLGNPCLVYGPWAESAAGGQFAVPNVRLTSKPVDIKRVAAECDLAILNGTHSTTAEMLGNGVPALHFPIFAEQALVARRATQLGAGILQAPGTAAAVRESLHRMLTDSTFRTAAADVAERWANQPAGVFHDMVRSLSSQLS
jgi:UDP:flavonoid glycosyltransferase YjiC (YdhE family)